MIGISVVIGVVLLALVLAPFLVGPGGMLAPGAQVNSPEKLAAMKEALLKRYLEDEAAHKAGDLSNTQWEKRKAFLVNRYVDTARRLDFLQGVAAEESAEVSAADGATAGGRT